MAGLLSVNRALFSTINERTSGLALYEVSEEGSLDETVAFSGGLKLQYFPETLTDTKEINYATKSIIGASLPVYQYVNSGARTISFTAVFSTDTDFVTNDVFSENRELGVARRNVDIRSAIYWLRSYMMPEYVAPASADASTSEAQTIAPTKLWLVIPNSGIGLAGGVPRTGVGARHSVMCVMTKCDVTYEAFFPSGLPRLAKIALSFAEIGQANGRITFPHMPRTFQREYDKNYDGKTAGGGGEIPFKGYYLKK